MTVLSPEITKDDDVRRKRAVWVFDRRQHVNVSPEITEDDDVLFMYLIEGNM